MAGTPALMDEREEYHGTPGQARQDGTAGTPAVPGMAGRGRAGKGEAMAAAALAGAA